MNVDFPQNIRQGEGENEAEAEAEAEGASASAAEVAGTISVPAMREVSATHAPALLR